jgi:argininosuccinate lyase
MADYLVTRGMPFRQAHSCVGKAVSYAIEQHKELQELTLKELKSFSPLIEKDIYDLLTIEQVINRKKSLGGTAKENVMAAIDMAEKSLDKEMECLKISAEV